MTRRFWTDAELEKLKREYPDRQTEDLADEFGCSAARVYAKANELGVHKSDASWNQIGANASVGVNEIRVWQ